MKNHLQKWAIYMVIAIFYPVSIFSQNKEYDKDHFIDNLLFQMTVEEKIGQLNLLVGGDINTGTAETGGITQKIQNGEVGGIFNLKGIDNIQAMQEMAIKQSRLKIPLMFAMDVIHGYETIFPIPLALSCTWDLDAIEQSARIAATEASADGICWTFSPMVDISRDPRWGRVAEGSGEDPFVGGLIAQRMVWGYQGRENPLSQNNQIMACVKHFALYGAAEGGRDYNTVDMSRQQMFNVYFPPFLAAVEAGVGSLMASFNEVEGVPATGNSWLLTDVLRNRWGFNGLITSDYTGISEMINHGMGDLATVSAMAINAGVDMDMMSDGFVGTVKQLITNGQVSMTTLNTACRRVLVAKYDMGLFNDPFKYCNKVRANNEIFTAENRKAAQQIATESFVLLKNDVPTNPVNEVKYTNPALPLPLNGTIAVIGPLANTRANMLGTWTVAAVPENTPTLMEGLEQMVQQMNDMPIGQVNQPWYLPMTGTQANVNLLYAKGSNLLGDSIQEVNATFNKPMERDGRSDQELLDEALSVAAKADYIVAALGESAEMSGEGSSRTNLELPAVQQNLLKALVATGKPVVLVLFTGRPLILNWEDANVPAILNVWFGGSEAAYAIGDVLFGKVSPSGKLTMSFPKSVGQIPLYYAQKNTGRPATIENGFVKYQSNYLDSDNEPLYPFGYGLTYTKFSYSPIQMSSNTMTADGEITLSVEVTNMGMFPASEVVQFYIRDMVGSVTRPVKELKGWQKIYLKPGGTDIVTFTIQLQNLKFYDAELNYVAETGEFEAMIGGNSRDVQTVNFTLTR